MAALYTFSATGNSLTTAWLLARGLGDSRVVPVASLRDAPYVRVEDSCVGFVFPVYYGTMPWPVRDLVGKMCFPENCYIFIVTTCRGHEGAAAEKMDQLLRTRGQKLSLSVGLKMPGNSFVNPPEVDAGHLRAQKAAVEGILEPIRARKTEEYQSTELLSLRPVEYLNNFRGLTAEASCIGCGVCQSVCPMENITLEDGRAKIGDRCVTCLACFHWCPEKAIWMSRQSEIARRAQYHHPDISLEDIQAMKRKENQPCALHTARTAGKS